MPSSNLDDPPVLFRSGTVLPPGMPRTLVVMGAARGGTTMVAQMLHDLGIFMGERLGATCQDAAMSDISRALFLGEIGADHPAIEQLLRSRDRQFAVWGWKFTSHLFEALYAKARNPHLIVVFRDPVAIATRESVSQGYAIEPCFRRALEQAAAFGSFALSTPYPCLAVSYERGRERKEELIDALLEFAGTTASPERRQQAAAGAEPGSVWYVSETRAHDIEGSLGRADSHIGGWLRYPHAPDRRVAFAVMIDGIAIHEGTADRFRPDLQKAFNSDGCCSFLLPVPDHFRDGRRHKVSIKVMDSGSQFVLNNDKEWLIATR